MTNVIVTLGTVLFTAALALVFVAGVVALAALAAYARSNPDIVRALLAMVLHREGGSWYPSGETPTFGFAVGGSVEGERVSANASALGMLMALTRVKERLSANANAETVLGIWLDNGVYYIDGSNIVGDARQARNMAHNRCELAYYDIEADISFEIEYNPTYWAITYTNGVLDIYGKTDKKVRDCIASINVIPSRAITASDLGKLVTRCKREGVPMTIDIDPDASKGAVRLAQRVDA